MYIDQRKEKKMKWRENMFSITMVIMRKLASAKCSHCRRFMCLAHFEGLVNGVWLCIYVFDADHFCPSYVDRLLTILTVSRNYKLASIPTLANDLRIIYQLSSRVEIKTRCQVPLKEESKGTSDDDTLSRTHQMINLDLNLLPYPLSENEGSDQSISGVVEKKKKRAAPKHIARLALEDLAKYFDVPIVEASKKLEVGLTVLKKKCREFGIPRWPHRKIKSLDGLIHDLQEEAEQQQEEDKAAALLVAKRQRMIENEKETIEKKPSMDIQRETKKFRQDIFKKRHRARVLENQSRTLSLF